MDAIWMNAREKYIDKMLYVRIKKNIQDELGQIEQQQMGTTSYLYEVLK